jgi:HlyD family secretion protein
MKRVVVGLILLAGVAGVMLSARSVSMDGPVRVDVQSVAKSQLRDVILASGNLEFARQVDIRPEVTGKVASIRVSVGESVKKGDLLLSLDASDYRADLARAEAELEIRRIEIRRMQELAAEASRKVEKRERMLERGFIDEESMQQLLSEARLIDIDLESARQRFHQQQALLDQARERLSRTLFHAPMDGVVTRVDVAAGETVVAAATNMVGSSMLTLADPDSYVAKIRVDEADIGNIDIGQETQVFPAASPNDPLAGEIRSVSLSADRGEGGAGLHYEVEVALADIARMFPGMSCRAEILVAQSDSGPSVPVSAVLDAEGRPFVWVAVAGEAKRRFVSTGLTTDTEQIVQSGLDASDVVIVGPPRKLRVLGEGTSIVQATGRDGGL